MLNISGAPWRPRDSSSASTQKSVSIVTDTRQASTLPDYASPSLRRYTNPLAIGMYVISIAHTWLGLLTSSPRSRYGYTVLVGPSPAGVGLAVQRLDAHPPHQCGDVSTPGGESLLAEQASHHPTACKRILMQLIDAAHQPETGFAHRPWPVVDAPAADAHCLCLAGERQLVIRSIIALRPAILRERGL